MIDFIKKFPDGEKLFQTNAVFNKIVKAIHNGMTFYEAVSTISKLNSDMIKQMEKLIEVLPVSPIFVEDGKILTKNTEISHLGKTCRQIEKMDKLVHDNLVEICKQYPNDQELGQQVRKLFNQ